MPDIDAALRHLSPSTCDLCAELSSELRRLRDEAAALNRRGDHALDKCSEYAKEIIKLDSALLKIRMLVPSRSYGMGFTVGALIDLLTCIDSIARDARIELIKAKEESR